MKYNISIYKTDGSIEIHERKKRGRKSNKAKEIEISFNETEECLIDDD